MTYASTPVVDRDRHARATVREAVGVRGPDGATADLEIAVSTEGVARDGGVIPVSAWDMDAYRRNPVVLLAHGLGADAAFPIGRAEWTVADRRAGELRQGWRFHEENEASGTAKSLYLNGFMRSASVGFRLHEWREPTAEEAEALQAELGAPEPPRWIAERAELLEVSAVAVPSDPDALALDWALSDARRAGLEVGPLAGRLRELRKRCRAGDARACRRLRGKAEDAPEAGRRLARFVVGGEVLEVPLRRGEEEHVMRARVVRMAAARAAGVEEPERWRRRA